MTPKWSPNYYPLGVCLIMAHLPQCVTRNVNFKTKELLKIIICIKLTLGAALSEGRGISTNRAQRL